MLMPPVPRRRRVRSVVQRVWEGTVWIESKSWLILGQVKSVLRFLVVPLKVHADFCCHLHGCGVCRLEFEGWGNLLLRQLQLGALPHTPLRKNIKLLVQAITAFSQIFIASHGHLIFIKFAYQIILRFLKLHQLRFLLKRFGCNSIINRFLIFKLSCHIADLLFMLV